MSDARAAEAFIEAAEHGRLDLVATLSETVADVDCLDPSGWTALLAAVGNGHVEVARFLLERGASTECRTPQSLTSLHLAVSTGNVEMLDLLCRFRADVNAHGLHGRTALHIALHLQYTTVASRLLDHGASVKAVDDDGNTALMRACGTGNVDFVVQVLDMLDGAGETEAKRELLNKPGQADWTPLLVAAARGDLSLVELLICHGANLEAKNADGCSPLVCATQIGHDRVVQCLLASGAITETTGPGGSTPLVIASKHGFGACLQVLLDYGARVNHKDTDGFSALHHAAMEGYTSLVSTLLKHGADPNIHEHDGWTPLLLAADRGLLDVVHLLLDHRADINRQSDDHWTPLTIGVQHGHVDVCELLLMRGASTDCRTQQSLTPVHIAATKGNVAMLELLCQFGADVNAYGPLGGTALHLAVALNLPNVAAFLLDHGAAPDAVDEDGQTVLMHACWSGKTQFAVQIVEKLDSVGASGLKRALVNKPRSIDNSTPLNVTADLGHLDLVILLVDHGAELEAKDVDGLSALNSAVLAGHEDVAQYLLAAGADTGTTDLEGATPLVVASKRGFDGIVSALLKFGAKVDHRGTHGNSALYAAAVEGHATIVRTLLEHGADGEIRQDGGLTALLGAAQRGYIEIVRLLVDKGGDVNCQNDNHCTPLIAAVKSGHMAVCELLLRRGASTTPQTKDGQAALHAAVVTGSLEMVDLLCRFGADIDAHGRHGWTALHFALKLELAHVIAYLVERGASLLSVDDRGVTVLMRGCLEGKDEFVAQIVDMLDNAGAIETKLELVNKPVGPSKVTPLLVAAERGSLRLIELLVCHGAEIETKDSTGYAPLHRATANGHADVITFLLASGAQKDATDLEENTALLIASKLGFGPIVNILLEYGAHVDHRGIRGFSALHHAAAEDHASLVRSLLEHGADPDVREQNGFATPLLLAADRGHLDVVCLLMDRGADIDCQGNDHWTPLIVAAKNGHTAICELLLARGASTTLQTTYGRTALHLAASIDHREIIEMLLQAGADPSTRDYRGHTAAYEAMMEGYFSVAELLERASGTTPDAYDDEVWPRHMLRELYGVGNTSEQGAKTLRSDPPWFIDYSSIASIEPCPHLTTPAAEVSVGTWLGSHVLVVKPLTGLTQPRFTGKLMEQNFRREVSNLYPLRHPHVIKLYGACHRGERPFLVMEHPQNGTLRSFVAGSKHRKWAILHDVAVGVQYLHERGFVHSSLTGSSIQVGDDGLAKLSAFGLYSMSLLDNSAFLWMASEVLDGGDPQFESDVYSLGMCIVEAVSGEPPYAAETSEKQDVKELITKGRPPRMPVAFRTQEWELVMKMICFEDEKRLKISDVVRELAALAQDEALATQSLLRGSVAGDDDTNSDISEALETVALLLRTPDIDGNEIDTETPQHQVFGRLKDIRQASEKLPPEGRRLIQPRIHDILSRFANHLQAQAAMNRAARFAAQRQHAERVFSFHNDIDRLLNDHRELLTSHLTSTMIITGQAWRELGYESRRMDLQTFAKILSTVGELDDEASTCLLYELTQRRDAYTSIPPSDIHEATIVMRSKPRVRLPGWFIPHYEVAFDAFQSFSRGAFGSVHHGEWMGARVVIKKVFADDDTEFEKEVAIWSQLYHPHVLQLFGACHVGQKFLVSEFAAQGQLDRYLHSLVKQPVRRKREVWRTLYESALGLQYLHARGVVHCDLKCNNILIGRDGKAKVSDYGLSRRHEQQEPDATPETVTIRYRDDNQDHAEAPADKPTTTHVGAPRWKAPEVLNGDEPTLESDVYSFGMCVVEAVTGEYPWGMRDRDELVSDHVRHGGELFPKPRGFSDAQWSLVVGACRFDPQERLSLRAIVALLQEFAHESCQVDDDAMRSEPDAVREPEPETTMSWLQGESAAFSEVLLPVAVDSDLSGVKSATPLDTHYEESW